MKKVRYQIAGAVGLVPAAVGMALPATAQAATNVKAQSSTGKTVQHLLAHPRGVITGCNTSNQATLPAKPAHNLLGGRFFYALAPDVCVGTIQGKFQWNKSFTKIVSGQFAWFDNNVGEHTAIGIKSVFNTIGSHTVSFGIHQGFTPATSGSGCITSQFAGGVFACTPVPI